MAERDAVERAAEAVQRVPAAACAERAERDRRPMTRAGASRRMLVLFKKNPSYSVCPPRNPLIFESHCGSAEAMGMAHQIQ